MTTRAVENPARVRPRVTSKRVEKRLVRLISPPGGKVRPGSSPGRPPVVDEPRAQALEFPPELFQVDFECVGRCIEVLPPHLFVDPLAREDLSGVVEEKRQECQFLGGEIEPPVAGSVRWRATRSMLTSAWLRFTLDVR